MADDTGAKSAPANTRTGAAPAIPVPVTMILLSALGEVRQGTLIAVAPAMATALIAADQARKASPDDLGMAARAPQILTDEAIQPHLPKGTR